MEVRRASNKEIPFIIHHRIEMLRSMGYSESILRRTRAGVERYLTNDWDESVKCFLAVIEETVVGGCAVSIYQRLPSSRTPNVSRVGYIHNVFVEPQFRKRGIATALMEEMLSLCRKEGAFKVALHDTAMSSGIYRRLGFKKVENYYDLWM
ncbi:MAG: GNAT family N-acetyltransferase [Candidatus Thorarchaeota archaeon]|jgi:ribosomal protein S18 acetylase RimI-like enzyme